MNRIPQFRYAITSALHIYRRPRYFWPSYSQRSRYHIAVCQVNTATHAVHWLTQTISVQEIPISYSKTKINHSIPCCVIVRLQFLLRH